jgi:hypothetical protein
MTYFSGMALKLENRRLRATRASFTKAEKKQLEAAWYFTWDSAPPSWRLGGLSS